MKSYNIIKLDNSDFTHLIIANTYVNPVNEFMADGKIPGCIAGNIIVDLTLINGVKANRYVSVQVLGGKVYPQFVKVLSSIPDVVKTISQQYFADNPTLVKNSVLPKAVKYTILNP